MLLPALPSAPSVHAAKPAEKFNTARHDAHLQNSSQIAQESSAFAQSSTTP